MKISYLIASNKNNQVIKNVIDNIYSLKKHDFEIITCTTFEYNDNRAICLSDDRNQSVYAFNQAYKYSSGDLIIICSDDHEIPENIIDLPKFFMLDNIKNLKIKIANLTHILGGPGKFYYNKIEKKKLSNIIWPIDSVNPYFRFIKNIRPYNVYHFPAILKESIEEYMGGVIFNESFIHHYCDSWLGFYEEKINGIRNTEDIGPHNIWFKVISHINNMQDSTRYDSYDCLTFAKLISISDNDISYNTKV